MTNIQLPYHFIPRDYQLPVLLASEDPTINRFILIWHRRAGKDKTALQIVIKKMMERVGTYYYILPTFAQGKRIIWDGRDKDEFKFLDHFPKELVKEKNKTDLSVTLKNGSMMQIIGSDKVDNIVGTNPIGIVFSEFPLHKSTVWDLFRPMLAENGGWAIFTYTPRGKNHGWDILQKAKGNPKWFSEILTVDDTGAISKDIIEEERKDMPDGIFKQEYYCDFIDGAGQFFTNIDTCIYDTKNSVLPKPVGRKFQGGVDLAKSQDFTVLTAIDLATFTVYPQERFNQVDWTTQTQSIQLFSHRYNNPLIYIDATGVGDPIFEALDNAKLKVEPFKFTQETRSALLNNLRILIDTRRIKIPNDPILIDELKSFRMSLNGRGRLVVEVPDGLHDDTVMSLALACWQLKEFKGVRPNFIANPVNKLLMNKAIGKRRMLGDSE